MSENLQWYVYHNSPYKKDTQVSGPHHSQREAEQAKMKLQNPQLHYVHYKPLL
jgi:hypothetical protein